MCVVVFVDRSVPDSPFPHYLSHSLRELRFPGSHTLDQLQGSPLSDFVMRSRSSSLGGRKAATIARWKRSLAQESNKSIKVNDHAETRNQAETRIAKPVLSLSKTGLGRKGKKRRVRRQNSGSKVPGKEWTRRGWLKDAGGGVRDLFWKGGGWLIPRADESGEKKNGMGRKARRDRQAKRFVFPIVVSVKGGAISNEVLPGCKT